MKYQFRTMDDELFVFDVKELRWGRASSILAAPSVLAAEQNLAAHEMKEEGILVPMGAGRYSFDGRTPKTEGPGAGLSTLQIMHVGFEDKIVVYLLANVKVKEDSFSMSVPANVPKDFIKYEIRNPEEAAAPPTIAATVTPIQSPVATNTAEALAAGKTQDDSL